MRTITFIFKSQILVFHVNFSYFLLHLLKFIREQRELRAAMASISLAFVCLIMMMVDAVGGRAITASARVVDGSSLEHCRRQQFWSRLKLIPIVIHLIACLVYVCYVFTSFFVFFVVLV